MFFDYLQKLANWGEKTQLMRLFAVLLKPPKDSISYPLSDVLDQFHITSFIKEQY